MTLEGVEAVTVRLALRGPVRSAGVLHAERVSLFIRVAGDGDSGWGECGASVGARLPDPSLEAVEPAAVDRVVARFFDAAQDETPAAEALGRLATTPAERVVAAALEMALLDLGLRGRSESLASWIGADRGEVETGALVGIPDGRDLGRLADSVGLALAAGARRVRVKIEPGWDHLPLGSLRDAFGDAVLMADANAAYVGRNPIELQALDDYGLACLEQPYGPDDLEGHRDLAELMETPIGLDESLSTSDRVAEAVRIGACAVACLKPSRLGGVVAARDAAARCAAAGVAVFVGGFFESGLGRAVNAALAGRPDITLPGDLGDPDDYLVENPFGYLPVRDGVVMLSDDPGLGATFRPDVFERLVLARRWLGRGA